MSKIKNVIFDVGMVLVNFRWYDYMVDLGFDKNVIEELGEKMVMSEFWKDLDRGKEREADAPEYFKAIMPKYKREIDLFWENIADIVREYDYSAPMIQKLHKAGYKVYLLSNYPLRLSELHWPSFSFINDVDGKVISAVEKMVKPEPHIYNLLMERYQLCPEECIFLDDRLDNIETARQLGMQGIVFQNYELAVEELNKAGVSFS
jgi:putative hydrolase of the HAD superfamily